MPKRKTPEELDKEIARLKRQRSEAVKREARAARKARDHAAYVAGSMVLSCYPDGWQSVDWPRLGNAISNASGAFAKMATDTLPWPEADARLRKFEREQRTARRQSGTTGK